MNRPNGIMKETRTNNMKCFLFCFEFVSIENFHDSFSFYAGRSSYPYMPKQKGILANPAGTALKDQLELQGRCPPGWRKPPLQTRPSLPVYRKGSKGSGGVVGCFPCPGSAVRCEVSKHARRKACVLSSCGRVHRSGALGLGGATVTHTQQSERPTYQW